MKTSHHVLLKLMNILPKFQLPAYNFILQISSCWILFIYLYIYSKICIFPRSWEVRRSAHHKHTSHQAMLMKFSHRLHYFLVNIVCENQLSTLNRKEIRVSFVGKNEFVLQVHFQPQFRARQTYSHFCLLVTNKKQLEILNWSIIMIAV